MKTYKQNRMKGKAKKVGSICFGHPTFGLVDLEFELAFDKALKRPAVAVACCFSVENHTW